MHQNLQCGASFWDTVRCSSKQFHSVKTENDAVVNWAVAEICNVVNFKFVEDTWPNHEVCNISTAKKLSSVSLIVLNGASRMEKKTSLHLIPFLLFQY